MSEQRIRNNRRRRQRQLKKNLLAGCLTGLMVILITLFGGMTLARAEASGNSDQVYKYFTSIQVEQGDSLWAIAENKAGKDRNTEEYIAEVMAINHLSGSEIHEGQYLVIPYYSTEFQ